MQDRDQDFIESGLPAKDALDCIKGCLDALYADQRKETSDRFASNMTYEELLTTLLLARNEIEEARAGTREDERD
jgi:hypothetical protein